MNRKREETAEAQDRFWVPGNRIRNPVPYWLGACAVHTIRGIILKSTGAVFTITCISTYLNRILETGYPIFRQRGFYALSSLLKRGKRKTANG